MNCSKVLVTGSDGLIGSAVVQELSDHGYKVTPVDKTPAQKWGTKIIDCEDLGQVISVMDGQEAVVHLAAIPSPLSHPAQVVFRNNILAAFNVLEAAAILGIKKIVMASSISAIGTAFGFRHFNPQRVPIDESHPLLSQDAYGLSKMAGEQLAEGFCRRIPDLSVVSLRFSFVIGQATRERFIRFHREKTDLGEAVANVFWAYVDVRDAASACRLALEYPSPGHEAFFIAAADLLAEEPIEDLLAKHYPGDYPMAESVRGNTCPVDSGKAARLLNWKPVYDWEGKRCD